MINSDKKETYGLIIISTLANTKITVALKVSPAPRVSTTPAGGGKAGLVIRPWRGSDQLSVIIVDDQAWHF